MSTENLEKWGLIFREPEITASRSKKRSTQIDYKAILAGKEDFFIQPTLQGQIKNKTIIFADWSLSSDCVALKRYVSLNELRIYNELFQKGLRFFVLTEEELIEVRTLAELQENFLKITIPTPERLEKAFTKESLVKDEVFVLTTDFLYTIGEPVYFPLALNDANSAHLIEYLKILKYPCVHIALANEWIEPNEEAIKALLLQITGLCITEETYSCHSNFLITLFSRCPQLKTLDVPKLSGIPSNLYLKQDQFIPFLETLELKSQNDATDFIYSIQSAPATVRKLKKLTINYLPPLFAALKTKPILIIEHLVITHSEDDKLLIYPFF